MIDHLEMVETGARVSYEDAANPRRVGRVVEVLRDGREYRVRWDDDGTDSFSDLRRAGWHLVADDPGGFWDGADVIHVVRRVDLIASGDLVPLPDLVPDEPAFAREAGFFAPVCLTRAAAELIVPNDAEAAAGQDVKGRLWDLLSMARMYRPLHAAEWTFPCLVVVKGRGDRRRKHAFRCAIAPGEDGEATVTILRHGES